MSIIKFENVSKSYDDNKTVLNNLNLDIKEGEFITLIGKSGCGKTTLLKLINALEEYNDGKLYVDNKEINEWDVIDLRRSIGYVIQEIGLMPHMNIRDNIGYVLSIKNEDTNLIDKKAKELINLVGLNDSYLDKYPRELSGGQKQRIGVARALASNPKIILMDEPFGAVDEINRRTLQDEILKLQKELNKTIIFVTHDIEEAFKLGDKIILIDNGTIVQSGTKEDLLFNPKNNFVRKFFGKKNFTSYLSCTKIKDYISNIEDDFRYSEGIRINEESYLIDAIEVLFYNGINEVFVENEKGQVVGKFSLSSVNNLSNLHMK